MKSLSDGRPRGQKECWGNKERMEKAERSISPQAARRQPLSQSGEMTKKVCVGENKRSWRRRSDSITKGRQVTAQLSIFKSGAYVIVSKSSVEILG